MQTIFEKKEPTWVHDITEATESASTRVARKALRLPTVVAFAVSTCIVGAAGNAAPMQIDSVDATSHHYVLEGSPFSQEALNGTWNSAMDVLRELGEDPDDVLARAARAIGGSSEDVDVLHEELDPHGDEI